MNKRKHGVIIAVESPPTLFDLIDVLSEAGMGELAQEYFGEAPAILARKMTLRRMPHTASGVWHQDGAFMGADIRSLNVWLALTHCGDDAPGLDVVGRASTASCPRMVPRRRMGSRPKPLDPRSVAAQSFARFSSLAIR